MPPTTTPPPPGSFHSPFTHLIIGAGPAGVSILVKSTRLNLLTDLTAGIPFCPNTPKLTTSGVCMLHTGPPSTFGLGALSSYTISSNTDASSFVTAVTLDRLDATPPEGATGTILDGIKSCPEAVELLACGAAPAPLKLIGRFLGIVAKRISTYLDATPSCKVHYLTKATAAVYDSETKVWCVSCTSPTSGVFSVYSRSITAATGGCQVIPSNIAFKKGSKGEDRMITSDFALTEAGMEHIKDMLGNPRVNAAPNRSRIAVIGGSHSAFSVLWTLLTKCTVQNENMAADSDAKGDGAGLPATPLPYPFTPQGILLLHRSPVTVFYNTTAQADKDSYVYSKTKVNSAGQVNVFGGLRGDAKALYRRLVEGKETKVKMYLAGATSGGKAVVRKACEEADCVIFCGGYQTNTIEKGMHVVDKDGKKEEMKLVYEGGQVVVNDETQIMCENGILPNAYGIGLGWGLKAKDNDGGKEGSSGRMDGYGIYIKRAATNVLGHIYEGEMEKVWGAGNKCWEERKKSVADKFERSFVPKPPPVVEIPAYRKKSLESKSPKKGGESPTRKKASSSSFEEKDVEKLVARLQVAKGLAPEGEGVEDKEVTYRSEQDITASVERLTQKKELPAKEELVLVKKNTFKSATEESASINRLSDGYRGSSKKKMEVEEVKEGKGGKKKERKRGERKSVKRVNVGRPGSGSSKGSEGDLPGLAGSSGSSESGEDSGEGLSCPTSPKEKRAFEEPPKSAPSGGGARLKVEVAVSSGGPKSVWGEKDGGKGGGGGLLPPMFSPIKRPAPECNPLFQRVEKGGPASAPGLVEGFKTKKTLTPTRIGLGSQLFVSGIEGIEVPPSSAGGLGKGSGRMGKGGGRDAVDAVYDKLQKRRFRSSSNPQGLKSGWAAPKVANVNAQQKGGPLFGNIRDGGGAPSFKNHVSRLQKNKVATEFKSGFSGFGVRNGGSGGASYDPREYSKPSF